jgi:hypothetical protein
MANVYATKTGNWNDTTVWNTGSLPTSSDDVYANGFTVTINQDITVVSVRTQSATGISAGGGFTLSAGRTVNANVYSGTTAGITFSATGTSTINGNCFGATSSGVSISGTSAVLNLNGNVTGGTATTASGVIIAGTNCVLNLVGNATGGSGTGTQAGVYVNSASAVVTITGNVYGSGGSVGLYMVTAGNVTINGNVFGGTGANCYGAYLNILNAMLTVNGDVTGGSASAAYGVYNNAISTVIINGSAIGGVSALGAYNVTTGTIRCITAKGSDTTALQGLVGANINGTTTWECLDFGPNGAPAYTGFTKMKSASVNTITVRKDDGTSKVMVVTDQVANGLPAVSDVRAGTVFDTGNKTGTCGVPLASQVAAGVAVDNTTGTVLLTAAAVKAAIFDVDVTALTASNSLGVRLKACATVETTGHQITSLNP